MKFKKHSITFQCYLDSRFVNSGNAPENPFEGANQCDVEMIQYILLQDFQKGRGGGEEKREKHFKVCPFKLFFLLLSHNP